MAPHQRSGRRRSGTLRRARGIGGRIPQRSGSASLVVVQVTRVRLKKPRRRAVRQIAGTCRRSFPKKCALTSPGDGSGFDAGGSPPGSFHTALELIGRRGAQKCGGLSSRCLLTIRGTTPNSSPINLSRRRIRTGVQVMGSPCAKALSPIRRLECDA
jgi:hypothetical protein